MFCKHRDNTNFKIQMAWGSSAAHDHMDFNRMGLNADGLPD